MTPRDSVLSPGGSERDSTLVTRPAGLALELRDGRLHLVGELDLATSVLLAGVVPILHASGTCPTPSDGPPEDVVDIAGLRFIDAAGLSALERVALDLHWAGRRLVLVGGAETVARTFRLGGLSHLLAGQGPGTGIDEVGPRCARATSRSADTAVGGGSGETPERPRGTTTGRPGSGRSVLSQRLSEATRHTERHSARLARSARTLSELTSDYLRMVDRSSRGASGGPRRSHGPRSS